MGKLAPTGKRNSCVPPTDKETAWDRDPRRSASRRVLIPGAHQRQCDKYWAAFWPLPFVSESKARYHRATPLATDLVFSTQLAELQRIQVRPESAGDVVKSGLPEHGQVEQALFHENDLGVVALTLLQPSHRTSLPPAASGAARRHQCCRPYRFLPAESRRSDD